MNTTTISIQPSNTSLVESYSKSKDSEIPSKHFYQYGTEKIEYFVIRTKRRKTSEIIVDSDEILLRVPYSKPLEEIESILKEKISWIVKKQKEISDNNKKIEITKPDFSEKISTLPYLGKNYQIEIRIMDLSNELMKEKENLVFKNDRFLFTILSSISGNKEDYKKTIKKMYEDWLYHHAEAIFKQKVEHFKKIINVYPKRIVVKKLKNRWGSISTDGTLNLNLNLIKAPEDVIDYIIIHELCHLKIKGHNHQFWNLLKNYIMNYEDKIRWLEKNGQYLLD